MSRGVEWAVRIFRAMKRDPSLVSSYIPIEVYLFFRDNLQVDSREFYLLCLYGLQNPVPSQEK